MAILSVNAVNAVNSAVCEQEKKDHVVLFPFLSKGHTIPLLHLAAVLCSRNVAVTVITTPANAPFVRRHVSSPNARFLVLPFPPHPDVPAGVESTDALPCFSLFPAFLAAAGELRHPFLRHLRRLLRSGEPPLCVISDFFFGWTLPICQRFRIPRLVFHGMSAFSMSLVKSLLENPAAFSAGEPFAVPGAPPELRLCKSELPEVVGRLVNARDRETDTEVGSWGVVVNSFVGLDPPAYVALFESFYPRGRTWLVGPLGLMARPEPEDSPECGCLQWLDRQPDGSVVYVAFGTQASVSEEVLDEVAHGLVLAGVRFLFAVRSDAWVGPPSGSGRIERGWVPQAEVLRHVAVGGFLSHCGWNSVLDAVAGGVPMLALPMIAEQHLNAKMVAEEIGVGLRVGPGSAGRVVGREEIAGGVRELMGGERGRRVRKTAGEMAEKAAAAVADGGSSCLTLGKMLEELRKVRRAAAAAAEDGVVDGCEKGELCGEEIICV